MVRRGRQCTSGELSYAAPQALYRQSHHTNRESALSTEKIGGPSHDHEIKATQKRCTDSGQVAGNLEFLQACERNMPKGKRIVAVRADSAAYQAAIFNWCEVTGKLFAIGADPEAAVKAAIAGIPESDWKTFRDGEIAETIHA